MVFDGAMTSTSDPLYPVMVEHGDCAALFVDEKLRKILHPGRYSRIRGIPILGKKRLVRLSHAHELMKVSVPAVAVKPEYVDVQVSSADGSFRDIPVDVDVEVDLSVQTVPANLESLGSSLADYRPEHFAEIAESAIRESVSGVIRQYFSELTYSRATQGQGEHAMHVAARGLSLLNGIIQIVEITRVDVQKNENLEEVLAKAQAIRIEHMEAYRRAIAEQADVRRDAIAMTEELLKHPDLEPLLRRGDFDRLTEHISKVVGTPQFTEIRATAATDAVAPLPDRAQAPLALEGTTSVRLAVDPDLDRALRTCGVRSVVNGAGKTRVQVDRYGLDDVLVLLVSGDCNALRDRQAEVEDAIKRALGSQEVAFRYAAHEGTTREQVAAICEALFGEDVVHVVAVQAVDEILHVTLEAGASVLSDVLSELRRLSQMLAFLFVYEDVEFDCSER
jgi:hypothetical protein